MLLYKFGFKNFWKKPLHAILSILLIVVSLSYTGVYMLIHEYNAMELTKLCYFSTEMEKDYGFFMKNNYMLFNYSNRAVAEKLKEELHSLGQGYSVDYLYEYNDRHGHAGVSPEIDYRIEQVFGLYDIENYIAKEDKKNTLYNSKGEIAPYFKYVSDVEGGGGVLTSKICLKIFQYVTIWTKNRLRSTAIPYTENFQKIFMILLFLGTYINLSKATAIKTERMERG